MARLDGYWHANIRMRRIERLTPGKAYNDLGRFKNYHSEFKKDLWLEDWQVHRNPRDAAIALANTLTAMAKKRTDEAALLLDQLSGLLKEHDIADCPYLAPVQVA